MKLFTLSLLVASTAAGLVVGWQLKVRGDSPGEVSSEGLVIASSRRGAVEPGGAGSEALATRQSSDTAMDLHALPAEDLYDRMALFLIEAKAEDFPAFYEEFQKRNDRNTDLNDLLFIAWTRVDPEAAIAASWGTDDFKYAYWARACHDPGAALASAKERNEGVGHAAWGIGEFHPQWLKDHWDEIPEGQRGNALQGLVKWPDTETPEATLRLLFESGNGYYESNREKTLLVFARQDPTHAYEVLKELMGDFDGYLGLGSRTLDSFIESLSRRDPGLLGEIAAVTKSPVDKNKIQLAQFKGLLREDPDSAKAMIESTPKSWLKEDLAITYASHILASDPERGFDYAVDFLKNDFSDSNRYTQIRTESGGSSSGNSNAGSEQLISSLLHIDAPALLNELIPGDGSDGVSSAFRSASSRWAGHDVGAYAEWLGEHQDRPGIYESGVPNIVSALSDKGEYEAGMEWAESIPMEEGKTNHEMRNLYTNWVHNDPEGAIAWRISDSFTGDPDHYPLPQTTETE
ncbi:hypothetical protein V2O64_16955 [Verrucomicrobiaceae bacterium 227]